ncbi:hemerythrin domain-containing protein [Cellulomonas sp. URHE0023]|uniref:hemerythrin domain-containing protein n=1 Tax=Cellulomonas sp. URHE0023 TaxID=1380354 RepID=UPI00048301C0|nr:hemerythrin domain-containing protein [Cellulomonas sp. URHE0023]
MTTTTNDTLGCDTSDMLHIHALFRRAFSDLPGLVRAVPEADRERMRPIAQHTREVAAALHNHHEGEDQFLWDTLEKRAPACALHVGLMRSQHAATAAQLERLDTLLPAWEVAADAVARDALAELLDEIRTTLLAHLGQEESQILPTAATVMSQREWGLMHEHGMASIPPRKLLVQLGWILDVIPADQRPDWLRANLPAPARLLWRTVGRRQFAAHRARIYGR